MKHVDPGAILAYAVAMLSFGCGVALLLGWWDFSIPDSARYTFGVVMILMAVYRVLVTRMKARRPRSIDRDSFHV
jgi:membrane protein insertase Oxa1/YidC/SpoIIIJ